MKFLALVAAAAALLATPALAQTPEVIRGKVVKATATELTVKPASGKPLTISLLPDWRVQVTKPISVEEIKPGSFIGTAEMPQADGTGRSLEVHVFPPGVKVGEGHYSWNLKKGSMMTNGTVGKVTTSAKGRQLELSYPNGTRKVTVPANVPVVLMTDGDRSQVKAGIPVFVIGFPKPGGGLVTGAVAIGVNGAKPPM